LYGHAAAIERDGWTMLILQVGAERNEENVKSIVDLLNELQGKSCEDSETVKQLA
jgi:hypothetical protein